MLGENVWFNIKFLALKFQDMYGKQCGELKFNS